MSSSSNTLAPSWRGYLHSLVRRSNGIRQVVEEGRVTLIPPQRFWESIHGTPHTPEGSVVKFPVMMLSIHGDIQFYAPEAEIPKFPEECPPHLRDHILNMIFSCAVLTRDEKRDLNTIMDGLFIRRNVDLRLRKRIRETIDPLLADPIDSDIPPIETSAFFNLLGKDTTLRESVDRYVRQDLLWRAKTAQLIIDAKERIRGREPTDFSGIERRTKLPRRETLPSGAFWDPLVMIPECPNVIVYAPPKQTRAAYITPTPEKGGITFTFPLIRASVSGDMRVFLFQCGFDKSVDFGKTDLNEFNRSLLMVFGIVASTIESDQTTISAPDNILGIINNPKTGIPEEFRPVCTNVVKPLLAVEEDGSSREIPRTPFIDFLDVLRAGDLHDLFPRALFMAGAPAISQIVRQNLGNSDIPKEFAEKVRELDGELHTGRENVRAFLGLRVNRGKVNA